MNSTYLKGKKPEISFKLFLNITHIKLKFTNIEDVIAGIHYTIQYNDVVSTATRMPVNDSR